MPTLSSLFDSLGPQHSCPSCNNKEYEQYIRSSSDGRIFCRSCCKASRMAYCANCKMYRSTSRLWGLIANVGRCCNSCVKTMNYCCAGDHYTNEELYIGPEGSAICSHCKRNKVVTCSHCNKEVWTYNTRRLNTTKFVCTPCFTASYVECVRCEKCILKTDSIRERGSSFCRSCYPIRNIVIHQHDFRPCWDMQGSNTNLFYGVELEVECKNINKSLTKVGVERGDRIIKHDGTIRNGFEIVSAPCTLDYHHRGFDWKKLCKDLVKVGCRSQNTNTCGLHVHFSKVFSSFEELKIATFIYTNLYNIEKLCRRSENKWAKIPDDISTQLSRGKLVGRDHYELLNMSNQDTIEFRLPKGTLNHKTILATIELLDSIIHYVKGKSIKQVKQEGFKAYLNWMSDSRMNRSKYAHLIMFYKNRKVDTSLGGSYNYVSLDPFDWSRVGSMIALGTPRFDTSIPGTFIETPGDDNEVPF